MYAHGELDLWFFYQAMPKYRVAKYFVEWRVPGLTEIMYKSNAENAEKSSNHEFWRKTFCLVAQVNATGP